MDLENGVTEQLILCCLCGAAIAPNPANMCVNCLKSQVDITEGISSQVTIFFCRGCGRYQNTQTQWVVANLESHELLSLCLKKVKGLNKAVRLVDAGFIWTEPHSRRLKVKLTIQKEVFNSTIMQQTFVVEYVCQPCQCPDCARSFTEHTWTAATQVRQKTKHKRTFFYLEQCLIKTGLAAKAVSMKEMPGGLDFFWLQKTEGMALLEFLRSVVPCQYKESRKLITQDDHSNFKKYKFTLYIEISPVCKNDLVIMPPKLCATLGGCSPLMLCFRVSSGIHLIDPLTLKIVLVSNTNYWKYPFRPVITQEQLINYVVIDIEKGETGHMYNKQNEDNDKVCLAEVTVARDSDFGVNDKQYQVVCHLGHILKVGDTVAGYDITHANFGDEDVSGFKGDLPEVILVKKAYQKNNRTNRAWKLKKLEVEGPDRPLKKSELQKQEADYEMFLREVEEDSELRSHVNVYKRGDPSAPKNAVPGPGAAPPGPERPQMSGEAAQAPAEDEEDDLPGITDMLDDMGFDAHAPPDANDNDEEDEEDNEVAMNFLSKSAASVAGPPGGSAGGSGSQ